MPNRRDVYHTFLVNSSAMATWGGYQSIYLTVKVSHPMFRFVFWKWTMSPWLLFPQDEGVVGPSGATGRALAGCVPAHPTSSALPCSALMEDVGQVFHLQGTSHLLPR